MRINKQGAPVSGVRFSNPHAAFRNAKDEAI
jgi:hypothetical protein